MKARRKIAIFVVLAMLLTFFTPLNSYETSANTIIEEIDLLPRSVADLGGFSSREIGGGVVQASITGAGGNLILTNSGGSYPDLYKVVQLGFSASRQIYLNYDFTVTSGNAQVRLHSNTGNEFKLGVYLGLDDMGQGTYTGRVNLNQAAAGLISNGEFLLEQYNLYVVGDGANVEFRTLEIYTEDTKSLLPVNQSDYNNTSVWGRTNGTVGSVINGTFIVADNGDYSSGNIGWQTVSRYPDEHFNTERRVVLKYDIEIVSGQGQIGIIGNNYEFKIGNYLGFADMPAGRYVGEIDLSDVLAGTGLIQNSTISITQVNFYAVGLGEMKVHQLDVERRVYSYAGEYDLMPINEGDYNHNWQYHYWNNDGACGIDFSSGTSLVQSVESGTYPSIAKAMNWSIPANKKLTLKYDFTVSNNASIFVYAKGCTGINGYGEMRVNYAITGSDADMPAGTYTGEVDLSQALLSRMDENNFAPFIVGGNYSFDKIRLTAVAGDVVWRELAIVVEDYTETFVVDSSSPIALELPAVIDSWSVPSDKAPQFGTVTLSNNTFYYQNNRTMTKTKDNFSLIINGAEFKITALRADAAYEGNSSIDAIGAGEYNMLYRIKNLWTGEYMYTAENDNHVLTGALSGSINDREAYAWIVEYYNGYVKLKNAASGEYIQDENNLGYAVNGGLAAGDFGSQKWNLEINGEGFVRFINTYTNNLLYVENNLGYVETIYAGVDYGTAKWYLEPCVEEEQRSAFADVPTSKELSNSKINQERWLSVPDSRLVINPYLFNVGTETAEGQEAGGWNTNFPQSTQSNRPSLPLNIGYLNPYYYSRDTGDYLKNAMTVLDSSDSSEAAQYYTTWAPHMLGFTAKYSSGMILEGKDFFYNTKTIVREINYTGNNAPILAGTYWGDICYVEGNTIVIKNTGAKKYTTTISFGNNIQSISFFNNYTDMKNHYPASGTIGTRGYWKVSFANTPGNHTITAAISINSDMYSIVETKGMSERAVSDTRLEQKLRNQEEFWNDFLRNIPLPGTFEFSTIDSKGVTPEDVERQYYTAWTLIGQDLLPENPETGFYHRQLACGKPSMWAHGAPAASYTAAWDSIYGYHMYAYIDADVAWDCFIGLMSLVEHTDNERNGILAGESLPVNRARTAWLLYQAKPDINNLRAVFADLDINLWWSMNHTYWIWQVNSSNINLGLRDSDFTAAVLVDMPYMIKICQKLGEYSFAQLWTDRFNQYVVNFQQWHVRWYDDGSGNMVQLGCNDGITGDITAVLYTTKSLYSPYLSPESDAAFHRLLQRDFNPNNTFSGFIDVKLEEIMYTLYGMYDNGYVDMAKALTESSVRDVVRANRFSEAYTSWPDPIGTGVSPSLFGAVQLIDSVWIRNGYRYDAGEPAFQNFFGTGSLKNIKLNGQTFDYVLENNTVTLTGDYIPNGNMQIAAAPNTIVKPFN